MLQQLADVAAEQAAAEEGSGEELAPSAGRNSNVQEAHLELMYWPPFCHCPAVTHVRALFRTALGKIVFVLYCMLTISPLCTLSPHAAELPAHLAPARAAVTAAHVKNRQRIAAQRRGKGEPKTFSTGDAVLLLPPKRGKVGSTIDRKRVVCRVVDVRHYGALPKYKLRCNAGMLQGTYDASQLSTAPISLAAELKFPGTDTQGVHIATLNQAVAAQRIGNAGEGCRCRGLCGPNCPCKKHSKICSRHDCRCQCSKGANCGNY